MLIEGNSNKKNTFKSDVFQIRDLGYTRAVVTKALNVTQRSMNTSDLKYTKRRVMHKTPRDISKVKETFLKTMIDLCLVHKISTIDIQYWYSENMKFISRCKTYNKDLK